MAGDMEFDEEEVLEALPNEAILEAKKRLQERCSVAGISYEEEIYPDEDSRIKIGIKCGRSTRWIVIWVDNDIDKLLSIPFEEYTFINDLEAICSYGNGTIEAGLRQAAPQNGPMQYIFRRLFGSDPSAPADSLKISLPAPLDGLPSVEISPASDVFAGLVRASRLRLTLKISGCHVKTHDAALALLNKVAGAVLFQLDLLTHIPMILDRERRRPLGGRRVKKNQAVATELQYPKTQLDNAPLSLYWYARSASSMPLLQFLAFYQVIEFYYPIYSQAEAQRKIKGILKDPVFRGDRDADVARLLSAIHVSRNGAFGDERSQLRATLLECIDPDSLREYLESDSERADFFISKGKASPYHKIPLANLSADLRNDVADRVYDIRCKIVHTKSDSRDGSLELLLPFSKEAEQLLFDIELVQYLAQQVLISGSAPFNVHG